MLLQKGPLLAVFAVLCFAFSCRIPQDCFDDSWSGPVTACLEQGNQGRRLPSAATLDGRRIDAGRQLGRRARPVLKATSAGALHKHSRCAALTSVGAAGRPHIRRLPMEDSVASPVSVVSPSLDQQEGPKDLGNIPRLSCCSSVVPGAGL